MSREHRDRAARRKRRRRKNALSIACIALALFMLGLVIYIVGWYDDAARMRISADRYRAMYAPGEVTTAAPTAVPTAMPTIAPTVSSTVVPTAIPTTTAVPTEAPSPTPTTSPEISKSPDATAVPTPTPSSSPTPTPAPTPTLEPLPAVQDELLPTPDPDTRVYALPTAPPVQAGFAELIRVNPEAVGFLDIDGLLSLPVAQRLNDNDYYLSHGFDGEETKEGSLFLDGLNRLVPEDDCLIVYGHNMKNGAMFGHLNRFGGLAYLKKHAVVRFDTLYENRLYVPFSAFTASTNPNSGRYFDVRRFIFDETGFDLFTKSLKALSARDIPVDVRYGDRLLLLVTCDSSRRTDRFVLALRQLRADETEDDMRELMQEAK